MKVREFFRSRKSFEIIFIVAVIASFLYGCSVYL